PALLLGKPVRECVGVELRGPWHQMQPHPPEVATSTAALVQGCRLASSAIRPTLPEPIDEQPHQAPLLHLIGERLNPPVCEPVQPQPRPNERHGDPDKPNQFECLHGDMLRYEPGDRQMAPSNRLPEALPRPKTQDAAPPENRMTAAS